MADKPSRRVRSPRLIDSKKPGSKSNTRIKHSLQVSKSSEPIYKFSMEAVLEEFDDGGLVLILPERRLVELNPREVEIVKLLDGQRTLRQVANNISRNPYISDFSVEQFTRDSLLICTKLVENGVLEKTPVLLESDGMKSEESPRFLRNPDVVLREEDPEEGALLFDPDTNQVKVINTTGMFIWQECGEARTLDEIVVKVQKGFDEVPSDQVALDVKEFIDGMVASGFIGTMENKGK